MTNKSYKIMEIFQNHMKTMNSTTVEQRENHDCENVRVFGEPIPTTKTPSKNNNYRSKSPLKPSNLGTLQTTNIIDLV